jgi:rubrerythrin
MSVKELCAKNIADEAEAIEGYYPLLDELEAAGDKEGLALVKEIISDEKNHLNLLQRIMLKHDNIDIAGDNMAETSAFLKKHAKD